MSDEARQCPVSPQELRFMADEIERRCDEALTQSSERGPCLICRKDAKRVRAVADWLEKPAPAYSSTFQERVNARWGRTLEDRQPAPAAATCGDCGVILPCKPYEHREGCSKAASEPTRAAEDLAQQFHETYERLAPIFGYETRRESAKPWAEVPEQNRKLMTAVCAELIAPRPAPPTAQARSFSDAHISRAVEIYCKVLDEDRGGTGAYLHMGTSGAMRAALESLGVDARDTAQARPTREQVDGAIVRGWCAHSFEDPLRQIFTSIADEIMRLLEQR